jgi:hypothetical protein
VISVTERALQLIVSGIAAATCAACGFGSPGASPPDELCTAASTSCASDAVLRTCAAEGSNAVETECPWGCVSEGGAHCGELVPAGGAIDSMDFDPSGLSDVELADTTINTDDGEILGVRPRDVGVKNGIDFQKVGAASVFRVKSLRVMGTIRLKGSRPIAIAAQGMILIEGVMDGRGDPICASAGQVAGPGGFNGGDVKLSATGLGGGAGTVAADSGGGGGGHGSTGGAAGGAAGAAGGPVFGAPEIAELVGGGGGGGGGSGGKSGTGGGGGAAIQLASSTSITIAAGGINAGGCGGDLGEGGNDGGGGGGAGGTILLEAPSISIAGALAVNGGGGGTHLVAGAHATLDRTAAPGAIASTASDGNGGAGGAGGMLAGGTGMGGTFGGGGGAVGRMRFHTRTGAVLLQAGAVLSPALDDQPTTTTQARARIQ